MVLLVLFNAPMSLILGPWCPDNIILLSCSLHATPPSETYREPVKAKIMDGDFYNEVDSFHIWG